MQKTSPFLPIVGFAASVSLLALLYYEKKRRKLEEAIIDNVDDGGECSDVDKIQETDDILDNGGEPENTENVNEVVVDVKASLSLTCYSSFEDDDLEMRSCQATDSSTSAYSTASDDIGPFPVGEFSTYKRHQGDLKNLDLHEILDSPVVADNFNDERMNRSPTHHCDELAQYYNSADTNSPRAVETTQVNTIVATYNDIVPPLRPNTGETIHSPKVSEVR